MIKCTRSQSFGYMSMKWCWLQSKTESGKTILSKKVSCIVMIFHINIPNFPLSFFLSRLSSFSSSTFSAEYMTSVRSAYFLPERTAESSCKMSCWYIRTEPIYQRNFKVFKYSSLESWHRKIQFLIKKMSVICWIK